MKIYLLGFMGAGKTTVGKLLAQKLSFEFIDLDDYIESKQKRTIPKIFREFGEEVFREYEKKALLDTAAMKNTVIATGGGAPCFFDNFEQMNKNGKTVYLKFSPEVLVARIRADVCNERPLVKKFQNELLKFVVNKLSEREEFYLKSNIVLDGKEHSPEQIVEFIVKEIKN